MHQPIYKDVDIDMLNEKFYGPTMTNHPELYEVIARLQRSNTTMPDVRPAEVGDTVIYHDPTGAEYKALVTVVHGPTCINVVYVTRDKNKQDPYGRQIERQTSLSHKSVNTFHGNYWRHIDEEPNPVTEPMAV